jgi:hypothetical protein
VDRLREMWLCVETTFGVVELDNEIVDSSVQLVEELSETGL